MARTYQTDPQDQVRFVLTGEAVRSDVSRIVALAGEICAETNVEVCPLVSPSILVDILPQPSGAGVLGITQESLTDYFDSTSMTSRGSNGRGGLYFWTLRNHMLHGHGRFDRYRRTAVCDCPLDTVAGRNTLFGYLEDQGIEPLSLIEFADLGVERMIEVMKSTENRLHKFGPTKAKVLLEIRDRLLTDLRVSSD